MVHRVYLRCGNLEPDTNEEAITLDSTVRSQKESTQHVAPNFEMEIESAERIDTIIIAFSVQNARR